MLIPFGGSVHAEGAVIIPEGTLLFQQFWFARDLGKRDFHGVLRHRNRKPREIRHLTFPRELFGREPEIRIYSGTVWTGTRDQAFVGNCLDETTGTIVAREPGKKTFLVQSRGFFFPSKALQILAEKGKKGYNA